MDFIKRTWAEIDLDALEYNIKSIKSKMSPKHKVMGIVKADAYGHGDGFVARKLQAGGFDWFGVSNIEEAISLRNEGITKPILVLGFTPADCVKIMSDYSITNAVVGMEHAKALQEAAAAAGVVVDVGIRKSQACVVSALHQRVDVNAGNGDGQQTDGGEHRVTAADIVGNNEGLKRLTAIEGTAGNRCYRSTEIYAL